MVKRLTITTIGMKKTPDMFIEHDFLITKKENTYLKYTPSALTFKAICFLIFLNYILIWLLISTIIKI